MKHPVKLALLSSITASASLTHGQSASYETEELAPVVVTADIWETPISEISASTTVISSDQIEASGSQHFEDLINSIPNVSWTGGTSRPRYIQIRGIGENSQFEGETPDSSVRFLMDDIDLTGLGTVGSLFDAEQVEVLRGAQSGAHGVNAAGGIIKVVSAEPTADWTGKAEFSLGEFGLYSGGVAIGGPLAGEELTFRLSTYNLVEDGYRENVFLNRDDTNDRDEQTTRLKLRWKPSVDFQLDTTFIYADTENGYDEFTLNNAPIETYSDQPGEDAQETLGVSVRASYEGWDSIELVSISQYNTNDSIYSFDGDWGAGDSAAAPFTSAYTDFLNLERERDVISQEIRFNSKETSDALGLIDRWTVGFYAHSLEEDSFAVWESGAIWDTEYDAQSLSIYGQATHEFSEQTRIELKLRAEQFDVDVAAEGDFYGTPFGYALSFDDTLYGGSVTLAHDFSDTTLGHVSINRGYKAGGASTPNFTAATDILYDTEILWTYEAGLKMSFFEESVMAGVNVFFIDRSDAQFRDSQGSGSFFDFITVNGDSAQHYGLEADAKWYLSENWTLSGAIGLLDAERDPYLDGGSLVESRELSNAPSYTYSARVDFRLENGFYANVEAQGSDSYFESNSHDEQRESYATVNGAIGFKYDNWDLTLWGRNLFDEGYQDRVFFFSNGYGAQRYEAAAAPRQIGATLKYLW